MNNSETPAGSAWEKIQSGVRTTERLIGQKDYNMAMTSSRQTLEYMVKCLCVKAGLPENNLINMIDTLYEENLISKTSWEHYHKIRMIGNKAIHENDNSAYNANQAHHLLSQEIYTFANDYGDRRKKQPSDSIPVRRLDVAPKRSSSSYSRSPRSSNTSASSGARRRRSRTPGRVLDPGSLLKPLLLIAIIVVLIFIIKMIRPVNKEPVETTLPITSEIPTVEMTEPTTETTPESTAPTVIKYKVNDTINVRPAPSTEQARIGILNPGVEVEFVRDEDDRWCVIMYNGQEAYVVKEYLTPVTE